MRTSLIVAFCAMLVATAVAADDRCELCDRHKKAAPHGPLPYSGELVCIRGKLSGTGKVTVHFLKPDGTPYPRSQGPHTGIFTNHFRFMVGRHWFEKVKRDGGIVRVCEGEEGKIGARFEEYNIDEHLRNGARCESEQICLFPGLRCPSE